LIASPTTTLLNELDSFTLSVPKILAGIRGLSQPRNG
jgi:hypothetical protein